MIVILVEEQSWHFQFWYGIHGISLFQQNCAACVEMNRNERAFTVTDLIIDWRI